MTSANGRTAGSDAPSVFLGLPTYDGRLELGTAAAAFSRPTRGRCRVGVYSHRSSLLASAFNNLWCEALNMALDGQVNRFAMLHADVCPEAWGWVDLLEQELQDAGADVVSVVLPIKDMRGLTSTALGTTGDEVGGVRRLAMREIMALPPTFRAKDVEGAGGRPLLVNTGCWLARLDRPWCRRWGGFRIRDEIAFDAGTGRAQATVQPEDWQMSYDLHAMGVDVVATRKVSAMHVGRLDFSNKTAWGSWGFDQKGEVG